ncbi:alkaline phosphatase family protein, partial [Streptomyces sp. NPDC003635]
PYVKVKAATALARKKLGMRYRMAVVPLDPSPVRGSHGRLPTSDDDGPLVLVSTPRAVSGRVAATDVKSLLLRLAGLS